MPKKTEHAVASPSKVAAAAERVVRQLFTDAGWTVRNQARVGSRVTDLTISRGTDLFVVEVAAVAQGSSVPLEQPWSMACLRARAFADDVHRPLAIVVAPKVSAWAAGKLMSYQQEVAPDVALGILDSRGFRYFAPESMRDLNAEPAISGENGAVTHSTAQNLFSDLNQWLLKVLLAPELKEGLIGAQHRLYRNATELAKSGNCSIMSAHRFVEQLRSEGFLDETSRHLRIVRREQLFKRWLGAKSHVHEDMPYRMVIRRDLRKNIGHYFPDSRACLGLFAAADELGSGFVKGVPSYVLVDGPSLLPGGTESVRGASELLPVAAGEPIDVIVRVPKAAKSVIRGAIAPKGVRCSDVIQTWLDVSNHASRGEEQAEVIWRAHLKQLVAR